MGILNHLKTPLSHMKDVTSEPAGLSLSLT